MSDNNLNVTQGVDGLRTDMAIGRRAGITDIYLGHPGIGKTEIINAIAADTTILPEGYELPEGHVPKVVGFYASQHEGTDISGYPVLTEDGEALSFKVMQKLRSLQSGDVLVIDEITLADESTMKPCLQLLSGDRPCVNDWVGPPHVTRIAMGNLADSGNYDFLLNPVQANRGSVFEWTGPSVDEWVAHALRCGIYPAIVAAIRMEGESLMLNWQPSRDRNPTPRSWFNGSARLYAADAMFPEGTPMDVRLRQLAACVGDPAALQVETLMHMQDRMVPYETVVASPHNCPLPDGIQDPSAQFLMATHVANKCVPDDWSAVMIYVERFPIELQQTIVAPIVARHVELLTTSEYANFASRTSGLL